MLRSFSFAVSLVMVVGCSHQHPSKSAARKEEATLASALTPSAVATVEARPATPAMALAFDPRVPPPEVALDLSRSIRQPEAFLGYDEGVVEFFSIRTEDRQYGQLGVRSGGSGWGGYGSSDLFERHAISIKTGVRYR